HGPPPGAEDGRLRPRQVHRVRLRDGPRADRDAQVRHHRHPSVLRRRPALSGAVHLMRVPLSWLRELVDITLPLDELVHRLNMSGTEVEDVIEVGKEWEGIRVAEVVALDPHPNADNLYVAKLDVGKSHGTVTVVTGATN